MQKRTDVNVEQANAQKQTPGGVLGKRSVQSSRTQTIVDKKNKFNLVTVRSAK